MESWNFFVLRYNTCEVTELSLWKFYSHEFNVKIKTSGIFFFSKKFPKFRRKERYHQKKWSRLTFWHFLRRITLPGGINFPSRSRQVDVKGEFRWVELTVLRSPVKASYISLVSIRDHEKLFFVIVDTWNRDTFTCELNSYILMRTNYFIEL